MKTARTRKRISSSPADSKSNSPSERREPKDYFNARGVIPNPEFSVARTAIGPHGIALTVIAHCIQSQWRAGVSWECRAPLAADATPIHLGSPEFATRSEAVESAFDIGLRQVRSQMPITMAAEIEQLRSDIAEIVEGVRADDPDLPLSGVSVVELCAGGTGGIGLALRSLGAHVQLAVEIDPEARGIYEKNVRPAAMHDDVCTLDGTRIHTNILAIGLMCQAYARSGNQLGFDDPKLATAYANILRLSKEIEADVVIVECARQFLNQDNGKDAAVLRAALTSSGYRVQHRTLNAAGFGVPQMRERCFIVATRLGLPVDLVMGYIFPRESAPTAVVGDILDKHIDGHISASEIVFHNPEPTGRTGALAELGRIDGRNSQGYRVYSLNGLGPTITASGGGRARCTGAYWIDKAARGLNAQEAYRMQGVPEWVAHHEVPTHALKHAGNAVAVPLARELGRNLQSVLRRPSAQRTR